MADYSNRVPQAARPGTVYGVDSAIVIVVSAALFFWVSVGAAVWLFF